MKKRRIKVVQFGLGQIGTGIAKALLGHPDKFELIGCVDFSPEKVGKDIGELFELNTRTNLKVVESIGAIKKKADVVVQSTVSFLPEAADQVKYLLDRGYNVVTTAEEIFFLGGRDQKTLRKLDSAAKRNGVRVLATGVNPGFVMDSLVLMVTAPCLSIKSIRAERMVNLSQRRLALQRKLGVGLSTKEFVESAAENRFGHAGLVDSANFLAHYLNIQYDDMRFEMQPVSADYDYHGEDIFVAKDHVLGVRQEVTAKKGDNTLLSLRLTMRIDASIEYDAIFVDGTPPVNVVINNGVMGDIAGVALIVNQIGAFLDLPPGYHDMSNIRIPRFELGNIG